MLSVDWKGTAMTKPPTPPAMTSVPAASQCSTKMLRPSSALAVRKPCPGRAMFQIITLPSSPPVARCCSSGLQLTANVLPLSAGSTSTDIDDGSARSPCSTCTAPSALATASRSPLHARLNMLDELASDAGSGRGFPAGSSHMCRQRPETPTVPVVAARRGREAWKAARTPKPSVCSSSGVGGSSPSVGSDQTATPRGRVSSKGVPTVAASAAPSEVHATPVTQGSPATSRVRVLARLSRSSKYTRPVMPACTLPFSGSATASATGPLGRGELASSLAHSSLPGVSTGSPSRAPVIASTRCSLP
mmetsp:Transcript_27660/g.71153  ORF Transcript_27660/g.71153 Transcript_27660/m.71153 type:complete len:304 (-) Transcript_27660:2986-3897(-)